MKNNTLWIIIVFLALIVGLCIGYIIGNNSNQHTNISSNVNSNTNSQDTEPQMNSAAGSYKIDYWNGKPAAMVLKPDGTCLYPTGANGTWSQNGSIIEIVLNGDDRVHTAEIVPGGLILHEKFFEAVS